MIEKYDLEILLKKYGINASKVIGKNKNILTYGEYVDIDRVLNYLINELKINASHIEKCPSIMYLNVNDIKKNVEFLKSKKIHFSNIESCLHVLSTDADQLMETYDYVEKNYGVNAIEKITSILRVSMSKIIAIESLNIPNISKNDILCISAGRNDTLEIAKIIHSSEFKTHPELFTSQTLAHAKLEDIRKLLSLQYFKEEKYRRLLTPSLLALSKSIIKKLPELFKIASDYGIDDFITITYLLKSPSQVYAIINYLNDNNIPLITDDNKLNPLFSYQPGALKKKYNIDLKELMRKYPFQLNYKEKGNVK